jgi:hypothetical protein
MTRTIAQAAYDERRRLKADGVEAKRIRRKALDARRKTDPKTLDHRRRSDAKQRAKPDFKALKKVYDANYRRENRERQDAVRREYYEKNKKMIAERTRNWRLKRGYGIDIAEYEALLLSQKGKCAICGDGPGRHRLAVDHCHGTGLVRGILCHKCNLTIGYMRDDVAIVQRLMDYLLASRP